MQSYIDFEISEGNRENTRRLYERLLQRTKHVKVCCQSLTTAWQAICTTTLALVLHLLFNSIIAQITPVAHITSKAAKHVH